MHPAALDDLMRRFAACGLARSEWTHEAHLIVGLWHVHTYERSDALARLRVGIRRLNDSLGTPNSATEGYHETITAAYTRLLAEFCDACPVALSLPERITLLLNSDLAHKDLLLRFYSRQHLMSPEARAAWVEPDLAPLRVTRISR
jgi:hypothetical protein